MSGLLYLRHLSAALNVLINFIDNLLKFFQDMEGSKMNIQIYISEK